MVTTPREPLRDDAKRICEWTLWNKVWEMSELELDNRTAESWEAREVDTTAMAELSYGGL